MVQKLETDPEKLREWQLGILIEIARRVLDEDEDKFPANTRDIRQGFMNRVAGKAAHVFLESGHPITFNRAMNLADDACKTVFAERGMTF